MKIETNTIKTILLKKQTHKAKTIKIENKF